VILETALKSVPASALPSSTQGVATERPSVIVISDWLANCRAGQWTPFEAATALKAALAKEGYTIVPSPDSKLEAYRTALEDAQERLANISSGRCPNAPPGTGGPVAFHEWASGYADIGYSVVRKALAAGG
jgi:hypothetical protein